VLFISRPNRFLVHCRQGKNLVTAHLPNPGRLQELLLPGSRLLIIPEKGEHRKNLYTVLAVKKRGQIIMLDTQRVNAVFRVLLEHGKIQALEGAKILRTEVRHGPNRFDFLLEHNGDQLYLEVKSCTLIGKKVAMFPDAVTARGTRHLMELSYLRKQAKKVAVIFLVQSSNVQYFMPDYHTDLLFAQTFLALRNQIRFLPIAIHWEKDLSLRLDTKLLLIPWTYLEREIQDRGSYLLVLNLKKEQTLSIGSLGSMFFPEGFYLYVGSAMDLL
jgi:sugar fermentation stimulation protein A